MADDRQEIERTEAPSPRWVARAREQGHWPRSQELVIACTVLVGLLAIRLTGDRFAETLFRLVRSGLTDVQFTGPAGEWILSQRAASLEIWVGVLLPAVFAFVAATMASVGQVGFRFRPEAVMPDPARFDLIGGLQRMFSLRAFAASLVGCLKWIVLSTLAVSWMWRELTHFDPAAGQDPTELAGTVCGVLLRVSSNLAIALVAFGLIDYARAWWTWHRQMQMSRAELVAELRETEGDPIIRRRRRQAQMERALDRSDYRLRTGDVVLVGRGRVAVAIRPTDRGAAVIVAKALGPAADRLQRAARRCRARIVHDEALARGVFRSTRVGSTAEIPDKPLTASVAGNTAEPPGRGAHRVRTVGS